MLCLPSKIHACNTVGNISHKQLAKRPANAIGKEMDEQHLTGEPDKSKSSRTVFAMGRESQNKKLDLERGGLLRVENHRVARGGPGAASPP
jgi:hypothetical protein